MQNGIIDNCRTLREELQAEGVVFRSDTDMDVIPNLLSREQARLEALTAFVKRRCRWTGRRPMPDDPCLSVLFQHVVQ